MLNLASINMNDLDPDVIVPFMVFAVGGTIAVLAIFSAMLRCIVKTRAREQSRREIAAYIAEGSMTPEQGERLMKANPDEVNHG